jgi:lipoprotein-anchoring transpeptidase ErfK/SrfK
MGQPRLTGVRSAAVRRRSVLGAIVGAAALAAVAACGNDERSLASVGPDASATPTGPAELSYTQTDNEVISPGSLVAVSISHGQLDTVTLTDSAGIPVAGEFDSDRRLWKITGALAYNTPYQLTVTGHGADGATVQGGRTFATLKPGALTAATIRAFRGYGPDLDGGTFGVGQPIVIEFGANVADRAAAQRALMVQTEPATVGAWRWVRNDEVHWRPKEYWQPGTKVTVTANLYGVNLGNNRYGSQSKAASFTIGPSKIAIADSASHRMHIFIDGVDMTKSLEAGWDSSRPGANYDHSAGVKVSMGKTGAYTSIGWKDYRSSSGVHVVMEKERVVVMRSSLPKTDPGYYEELVPYGVRYTSSGEYVHWADWSVADQGNSNVSHGCINVSPNDAVWFFNNFNYGDIVEVRNTGRGTAANDGLTDWDLTWEQWTSA